jgi:hypothetical protein
MGHVGGGSSWICLPRNGIFQFFVELNLGGGLGVSQ